MKGDTALIARILKGLIVLSFVMTLFTTPVLAGMEEPDKQIELRCDFPGQMIEAGDTVTFDLMIVNRGPTATYNLVSTLYGRTSDWDVTFRDGSKDVYKVLIPEGGSKMVTLAVDTSGNTEVGEYSIRVGVGDDTIWLYVKVTKTHQGEKGTLEGTIVDKEGGVVKGASVSVYQGTTLVEQMRATAEGKVTIELPMGTYRVLVEQTGYKSREIKDLEIRIGRISDLGIVPLEKEMYCAEFSAKSAQKTVMMGSRPVYEFRIKNIGKVDDTYRLTVTGLPDGWYAGYKETIADSEGISEISLKSGEEKTLFLEFIPPYGVSTGEYTLTSVAESSTRSYEENLTLKIRGSLEMQIYSRVYRYELNRGETVSFDITAQNTGTGGSLTNISPEVSAPQGWRASIAPEVIASLGPGERGTFRIQLMPPADIVAGEYKVNVKVKSEQLEKVDEFRIVVKEQSYIAILGILLLGAVGGGLWYIYRKYGRR